MATVEYFRKHGKRLGTVALALIWATTGYASQSAADARLWPNTSIRLTIVQWMPTKGIYEKWDALGGEFTIAPDGALSLPVIGRIAVEDLDEAGLAARIAAELKARIGLVNAPEATVAVVKYPPIYVIGDVKTPGTYEYKAGLTALKALAVSGGEYRQSREGIGGSTETTDVVTQLRSLENSIMRSRIRIARFRAELSDAPVPGFDLPADLKGEGAEAIYVQEKAIMMARANLMKRQAKSYGELRDLLQAEIDTLDKKSEGSDADIASVAKELRNIKSMVDKGIALPAKQGDLERMLRSYSSARLDLSTDIMRARQGIAETSRNLEAIFDQQRAEVSADLQNELATLDQLLLKRDMSQQHMLTLLEDSDSRSPATMTFLISRQDNGEIHKFTATDDTALQPSDVLRVIRRPTDNAADVPGQTPHKESVAGNSQ